LVVAVAVAAATSVVAVAVLESMNQELVLLFHHQQPIP